MSFSKMFQNKSFSKMFQDKSFSMHVWSSSARKHGEQKVPKDEEKGFRAQKGVQLRGADLDEVDFHLDLVRRPSSYLHALIRGNYVSTR